MNQTQRWVGVWLMVLAASTATAAGAAESRVRVVPQKARMGDAVLVTVTQGRGAAKARVGGEAASARLGGRPGGDSAGDPAADAGPAPSLTVGTRKVQLHPVRGGYQGLVAIPLDEKAETLDVRAGSTTAAADGDVKLTVLPRESPEVAIDVEEIFVDPPTDVRRRIEEDEGVIAKAYRAGPDDLLVRRPFAWPRARKISGRFGDRRVFNGRVNSVHQGTDLAGPVGSAVRAANDGTVVLSRELFYSGNTVIVAHGAGVYTAYLHLASLGAEVGTSVRRGELVGKVGETGRTTGAHLHFGVHVDGRYVDPESFMRLPLRPTVADR